MIFHSWKQSSYNCFTYEIWKLVNLFCIATFFKPPSLKFLQIVLCFSLRLLLSQKKVWIVSKVLMMWLGTDTIKNCFWHCETFKNNYLYFKSEIVKLQEFHHSLHTGNNFGRVTFFLYCVLAWEVSTWDFNSFITQVNAFHISDCQLNPFQGSYSPYFVFC